jgi:site-specific DNA recombinase
VVLGATGNQKARAAPKGSDYEYFVCMGRKRGECDLPYLPAFLVEDYVVEYYRDMRVEDELTASVRSAVRDAVADEQAAIGELHKALEKKLADLDKREERLIDLAEEGLPQQKIRERLNKLREERAWLEADVAQSSTALAAGAETLESCIELAADVRQLYIAATDEARSALNDAIFRRLYIGEGCINQAELRA